MYSKKLVQNEMMLKQLKDQINQYSKLNFEQRGQDFKDNRELVYMLVKDTMSALTKGNQLELLINGEKKFPQVLRDLETAKHHIHIQYYIYEDDKIGQTIENILIRKANEGVKVRFIFDDFGSHTITKKMVKRLKTGNVEVFPFQKIKFIFFANRINHRNHRKIIVIDGQLAYVGGINVSDKYINPEEKSDKLYWRDTHLRIFGPGAHYLQYLFLCDWNFCAKAQLQPNLEFFPYSPSNVEPGEKMVQIAAGGPDSDSPTVLYSLLQAVNIAQEELLITTPYYIPDESIQQSLIMAGLGGIKVKLLVPGVSDSALVNAAARAYYGDLLKAGVEIYLYQRGFVHAKNMVLDIKFGIVGKV
jgi:cardiolipin synthase